jgi:hypothetical protein
MGSTRNGACTLRWAMIEDPAEEFLTASGEEGSFGPPAPRRCDTSASPSPTTMTPGMENALTTQATMMITPRTVVPRSGTNLPIEQHHTRPAEREVAQW